MAPAREEGLQIPHDPNPFPDGEAPPSPDRPWLERPPILALLEAARPGSQVPLPQDSPAAGVRFAPGALDGIALFHTAPPEETEEADFVYGVMDLLTRLVRGEGDPVRAALYRALCGVTFVRFCDTLLDELRRSGLDRRGLHPTARWLLDASSHPEPLKLGIALLEVCGDQEDLPDLMLLARHDEFTIFVADALWGLVERPVDFWMALAGELHGWGKIHVVLRLCSRGAEREDVRDFLLRKGCQNTVMDEYLAWPCAEAGDLAGALAAPDPDEELLEGASALVAALCRWGGPGGAMPDYAHGVDALRRFLGHLEGRAPSLPPARALVAALQWLEPPVPESGVPEIDEALNGLLEEHGWTDGVRLELALQCVRLLQQAEWRDWARRGRVAADPAVRQAAEEIQSRTGTGS